MDESKMRYKAAILFKHMRIGMIFYTHPTVLTFEEINFFSQNIGISKLTLDLTMKDLVLHGIISAHFIENYQLGYSITEFGQYFFRQFCSVNEDAANYMIR